MLLVSFLQIRYKQCHTRKASVVYIGLKDPVLPVSHNSKQIAEATVSVHQFLSKAHNCKLMWKRGLLNTGDHRTHHCKQVLSLTTGQRLAHLLSVLIHLFRALCHQIMLLAAIHCCAAPAQLVWRLCPRLGVEQLINAPEQLVMSSLADVVRIHDVCHVQVASKVGEYVCWLAALGLVRLDSVNNYPVFLVMTMSILSSFSSFDGVSEERGFQNNHVPVLVVRLMLFFLFSMQATCVCVCDKFSLLSNFAGVYGTVREPTGTL